MGERQESLKEMLLQDMDDLDLTVRKLAETMVISKDSRAPVDSDIGVKGMVDLLTAKGAELTQDLQRVSGHMERREVIGRLEEELQKRDAYIEQLQNCLKESETVLISAVFQANQKLKSVNQAQARKVDSEELIKFAHKISKTNAVAAPPTWQQDNLPPTEPEFLGLRPSLDSE